MDGGTRREQLLQMSEEVVTDGHMWVDCMEKKPHKEFIPLGEKVLATPMSTGLSFGVE